ncbi:MAG: BNR-4 repeat-containing protein [Nonlabens sp.]
MRGFYLKWGLICSTLFLCDHLIIAQSGKDYTKSFSSQEYTTVSYNGTWSWFSDPRAVYYEGAYKRTYLGWTDNYGNILVSYLDHETGEQQVQTVYENLEIDDHNNPSILIDEQGYLTVYFTSHLILNAPVYSIKSKSPENIDQWEDPILLYLNNLEQSKFPKIDNQTYTHPLRLSDDPEQWYLFTRGLNMLPSLSLSKDAGKNWGSSKVIYESSDSTAHQVPYFKVYSKGSGKVHIFMSSNHPSLSDQNNLYYFYMKGEKFYDIEGQLLSSIEKLPINQLQLMPIRTNTHSKAWIWDVKEDNHGFPVLAYTEFEHKRHQYKLATYNGTEWIHENITASSGAFTEFLPDGTQLEPYYSGGIAINPNDTDKLIVSADKNGVFELARWEKKLGKWLSNSVTSESVYNNVRPVFAHGTSEKEALHLFWLQILNYKYYSPQVKAGNEPLAFNDRFLSQIKMNIIKEPKPDSDKVQLLTPVTDALEQILNDKSLKNKAEEDIRFQSTLKSITQLDLPSSLITECQNWLEYQRLGITNTENFEEITAVSKLKEIFILSPESLERRQFSILINHFESTPASDINYIDLLVLNKISKSETSLLDRFEDYQEIASGSINWLNNIKSYKNITTANFEKINTLIILDLTLKQLDSKYLSPVNNQGALLNWLWSFQKTSKNKFSYNQNLRLLLKGTSEYLLNNIH